MRCIASILLMLFMLVFTACSYLNSFVVVNASDQALKVYYKIKQPNDPRMNGPLPNLAPFTKAASQVHEQVAWQQLLVSRYQIDPDNRTVTLILMPGEALLLDRCRPANGQTRGDCEAATFSIEEIALVGTNGEINLKGEQAHKIFKAESNNVYTLTYD